MTSNILTTQIDPLGVWRLAEWAGLSLSIIASIFIFAPPSIGRLGKALWSFLLIYALTLFEFPYPLFGIWSTAYQATAGQVFAEVLFIPIGAIIGIRTIPFLIPYLVCIEMVCVWIKHSGLMVAPSFSCALIALCIPFLPAWVALLALITILFHHGSTALLILGAHVVAWMYTHKKLKWIFVPATLFLAAQFFIPNDFFQGMHERLMMYGRFMPFWASKFQYVALGVGPGSFMWCSLLIDKLQNPQVLQLHSDWLQILFEYGYVGLFLGVAFTVKVVRAARSNEKLLAGVLGAIVFGSTYHPSASFRQLSS